MEAGGGTIKNHTKIYAGNLRIIPSRDLCTSRSATLDFTSPTLGSQVLQSLLRDRDPLGLVLSRPVKSANHLSDCLRTHADKMAGGIDAIKILDEILGLNSPLALDGGSMAMSLRF